VSQAALSTDDPYAAAPAVRTDTLAASVVILLVMSVAQRLVGFGRGVLFCRWLEPGELGRWDMAMGFLYAVAPLVVLGLPGSLGRYSEHYRQRGLLKTFLRRTAVLTVALAGFGVTAVWLGAPLLSRLVFGTAMQTNLVILLAVALAAVIGFNFIAELFTSLRLYRFNSVQQLFASLSFAIISIGLILFRQPDVSSIVIGFAAANLLVFLGALLFVRRTWRLLPNDTDCLPQRSLWMRVMPFAAGVWVVNWLSNAFEIVDRYMIVHFSGMNTDAALVEVGNYHSARVVPLLLISLSGLLAGIILPHLSKDWESGRADQVGRRLNLTLKLLGFALSTGAVVVLFASPLLFGVAFGGKYDGGLVVLPLTLTYCTWLGMAYVAEKYLWCAEKIRLASFAFLCGLVANVGLNLLLLPRFGLLGAVLATTIANLLTLVLILCLSHRMGFPIHWGTCVSATIPMTFWLGPWASLAALLVVLFFAISTDKLLHADEKQQLLSAWRDAYMKIRALRKPATQTI
jgi:O-antigen/teichoic acid export membrane protein